MSNTGFVDVDTARAGSGSTSVPGLGSFAPLAGPVVGPDGTVFLGTVEGKVLGLHADGSPYWNRQLPGAEQIMASPALASDGSIYVVGARVSRDHRDGEAGARRIDARLYRFTTGGGAPGSVPLPQQGRGAWIVGGPAVWQFGADQAVIVPVVYRQIGGHELHLIAFSPDGDVIADVRVSGWNSGDVTGGWPSLPDLFPHGVLPIPATPAYPAASIAPHPQGGTPWIVVCDRFNKGVVGFTFCIGPSCTPAPGFWKHFETSHAPRELLSAPVFLPDMHTAVGTDRGIVFSGPTSTPQPPIAFEEHIYAMPTVLRDGSLVLVSAGAEVIVLRNGAMASRLSLPAFSIARAAASRTHVFVATTEGLYTLDAGATTQVFAFPWVGGGWWPPAIGPQGHVYGIASNILFVFPPPRDGGPMAGGSGPGGRPVIHG